MVTTIRLATIIVQGIFLSYYFDASLRSFHILIVGEQYR